MWYGQDEDLYIYDILCEERTFFCNLFIFEKE